MRNIRTMLPSLGEVSMFLRAFIFLSFLAANVSIASNEHKLEIISNGRSIPNSFNVQSTVAEKIGNHLFVSIRTVTGKEIVRVDVPDVKDLHKTKEQLHFLKEVNGGIQVWDHFEKGGWVHLGLNAKTTTGLPICAVSLRPVDLGHVSMMVKCQNLSGTSTEGKPVWYRDLEFSTVFSNPS